MASVNKVILVGNLGRDPEMRYMPSGDAICTISVATTDTWKDKASGEKREQTEWHRVTFFGRQAEIAGQYLRKGSQVYIEGSLRTRKYQDKDGIEKYSTEIRAETMQMLGGRQGGGDMPARDSAPSRGGYDNGPGDAYSQGQPSYQAPQQPQQQYAPPPAQSSRPAGGGFNDMDDDIPF